MATPKKYNSRELTNHLRELAAEAHDMTAEGDLLTKGEALARLLFQKALGFSEEIVDDEGFRSVLLHKPEPWAIQLIYDRIEGKTPQAITEDESRIKAADKVRALVAQRLNSVTDSLVSQIKGPPPFKKKVKICP